MDKGFVVWITGLPSSGKTTIARLLGEALVSRGRRVEVLDGDEVRRELSPDLGFSRGERELHVRRVAYIGKLLSRNGVAVVVALISPYKASRRIARELIGDFVEVYTRCSLEVCIRRDSKGLYSRALRGEIQGLTGIQDPYEEPENAEITLDTEEQSPAENVDKILSKLREIGYVLDEVEGA